GTFSNPDDLLLPGLFVRVRLPLGTHKALLVAEGAVGTDKGKKFVLVVNEKGVVEKREVKVGRTEDGLRIVEGGLTAAEWVGGGGGAGEAEAGGQGRAPRRRHAAPRAGREGGKVGGSAPTLPVARRTARMGHGDDVHPVGLGLIYHAVGVTAHHGVPMLVIVR